MEPLNVAASRLPGCKVPHVSVPALANASESQPSTAVTTAVRSAVVALVAASRVGRGSQRRRLPRLPRKQQGPSVSQKLLNPSQQKAVRAKPSGQQLIIAGAGSGKTTVLTERLAWLLQEGVHPREVLLLTFTKSAAEEMKARASHLVGERAQNVLACTFHSFCAKVLRKYAKYADLPSDYIILDESDALKMITLARKSLGFDSKEAPHDKMPKPAKLRKIFANAVSLCQPLLEHLAENRYWQLRDVADAIDACEKEYVKLKRAENAVDFDDLQVFCHQILENSDICKKLAQKYQYILVDEYQDTDRLQESILQRLVKPNLDQQRGQLTVVGDDAQGIYGFRGASVENIYDFEKVYPDVAVFKLEENYRSPQPILELANGVMQQAEEGYRKNLFSQRCDGLQPQLCMFSDEYTEAEWLAEQLRRLHSEGNAWRDMAVLFRRRAGSRRLQVELDKADVPYRLVFELKWTESHHMRDIFALLRCAFIPRHRIAWKRVLTLFKGVGPSYADQIYAKAFDDGRLDPEHWTKNKFYEDLLALANLIDQLQELNEEPERCVTLVKEFYQPYFEAQFHNHQERSEDFELLESFVGKWSSMRLALNEMLLEHGSDEKSRDVVTLSTIHKAKGLEWNNVFLIDLVERSMWQPPNEEELRILYVGITRARERLFLSCPGGPLSYWLERTPDLEQLVETHDYTLRLSEPRGSV